MFSIPAIPELKMNGIPDMKKLPGFGIERDRDQALVVRDQRIRVSYVSSRQSHSRTPFFLGGGIVRRFQDLATIPPYPQETEDMGFFTIPPYPWNREPRFSTFFYTPYFFCRVFLIFFQKKKSFFLRGGV